MFTLEVINSETDKSLEAIDFDTYRDLSQYVRDTIEWGIKVENIWYKVGNVMLDGRNVYIVAGKETY